MNAVDGNKPSWEKYTTKGRFVERNCGYGERRLCTMVERGAMKKERNYLNKNNYCYIILASARLTYCTSKVLEWHGASQGLSIAGGQLK